MRLALAAVLVMAVWLEACAVRRTAGFSIGREPEGRIVIHIHCGGEPQKCTCEVPAK